MRHLLLSGTLVLLGLLALASPVQASEWIEGDGFSFRLPDGFERLSGRAADEVTSFSMSMGGGLLSGPDMEMEIQAFVRNQGTTEQGVLAVVRMTLGGDAGDKLKEKFDPRTMVRQMQREMERAPRRLGANTPEMLDARTITLGASHEAAQMVFQTEDPKLGDQIIRMAFSNYESSVYIFMLQGPPARDAADEALWRAFTTTVKLESVGGIGRMLVKYWPYLLGAVVLLILVVALRSGGAAQRPRVSFDATAPAGEMSADGASFSRAMDGLPMYGDPGGSGGGGGGAGGPDLAVGAPLGAAQAAPPQTHRTLPTSAPPELSSLTRPDAGAAMEPSEADLARPPMSRSSTASLARASGQGEALPPSPGVPRPTNVAVRAPAELPSEADLDASPARFQRNQDFLG